MSATKILFSVFINKKKWLVDNNCLVTRKLTLFSLVTFHNKKEIILIMKNSKPDWSTGFVKINLK